MDQIRPEQRRQPHPHRGPSAPLLALVPALCVGLVAGACSGGSSPASSEGRLDTPDGPLAWVRVGDGPAHVVVHGGPGLDHRYLRPGMDALARNRSLVYYDQRGVGGSLPDTGTARPPVTWQGAQDDLGAMADRFGDDDGRVGLVAHSWGALPALAWAIENPDRVRSLVLIAPVEPGTRYQEENRRRQRERTNPEIRARLDSILAEAPPGWRTDPEYRSRVWRLAFKLVERNPEVVDELDLDLLATTARSGDAVAQALARTGAGGLTLWDRLHELYAPVLVVHGAEDVGSPDMARELSDSLPRGRTVILDDVGHFPFVEAPERLTEAVDEFLAGTEGG